MKKILTILICFVSFSSLAFVKNEQEIISTCFTPPQECGNFIVNHINQAKQSIRIQAYGFTSEKIIDALIQAKSRGVKIEIILDRSNFNRKILNTIKQLNQAEIPVYKDNVKGIAHNKVMIIDGKKVITGSFNFTKNADYRNAENVVIINEKETATHYMHNWSLRLLESERM